VIKKERGHDVHIEPGGRGQFDVFFDSDLIYSKHQEGRFPEDAEVLAKIPQKTA
jgi:selT/selW/selH-like putative selenoprotein